MEVQKENRSRLLLLVTLLLLLSAILYFRRIKPAQEPARAEVETILQKRPAADVREMRVADANAQYIFKAFPGSVRIERDLQAVSPSGNDPTALDGMDREQLTAFRLKHVEKYRQLGFYHPGYSPFYPPHRRIYGYITPGASWLYSVPYYLANPYLLIILVAANHVTPIDIYVPEVNVLYQNGTVMETIQGASARRWFDFIYSSDDYPGQLRAVMVNAWDAGFYYIHLDPSLSRNVKPDDSPDHISRTTHSQSCIFHVGKYKKNNLSPEDRRAWIELAGRNKPTRLYFRLWRSKPAAVGDPADLVFVFNIDPQ